MGFNAYENRATIDDHVVSFDKVPTEADRVNGVRRITKGWEGVKGEVDGLGGLKLSKPDVEDLFSHLVKEQSHAVIFELVLTKSDFRLDVIVGNATFKHIVADYFEGFEEAPRLDSVGEIFRVWNRMHADFKDRYFLQSEEDKEEAIESTRLDALIANSSGIFGVSGQRTVQEFAKFYAYGSGSDYALGALYSVYDRPELDAAAVARHAVRAASEFDDGTGEPIHCFTVPLLQKV